MNYETSEAFAKKLDAKDPFRKTRKEFYFPKAPGGKDCVYFAGNSLGLQPKNARKYIDEALTDWAKLGVEGHFKAKRSWLPYHELLTEQTARLVGAKPVEVVVMNTLTVNLHLMMVSFYRPTPQRYKILCEATAFPSDQYAVQSQAKFHGYDPKLAVLELKPRTGEDTLRTDGILERIAREGDQIALVMLGNVNYLTGQFYEIDKIVKAARKKGCNVGFNLAHGAGNLHLKLHDWDVDFAVWCNYKYLNAGPGGLAGAFVHEKHARDVTLPRFAGWWGHDKKTRFSMGPEFKPIPGAEGWQLSNPPIFQLAALRASMEIFDRVGMKAIREKSEKITGYLEFLLDQLPKGYCTVTTPRDPAQRGAQLSLRIKGDSKKLLKKLHAVGVVCDFREPDIVRAAPAPLYNSYLDVYRFVKVLEAHANGSL